MFESRLAKAAVGLGVIIAATGGADYAAEEKGHDAVPVFSLADMLDEMNNPDDDAGNAAGKADSDTTATTEAPVISDCVEELDLEIKIGRVLMPGIAWKDLANPDVRDTLDDAHVGGVAAMTGPDKAGTGDIADFKASQEIPPLIATDVEGGSVNRFEAALGPLDSAQAMVTGEGASPAKTYETVKAYGEKLKAEGVDMVFGPVVDVDPVDGQSAIGGERTASAQPANVTIYGRSFAEAMKAADVIPTLKHWPGHGSAEDTHDRPAATPELSEMEARDMLPFNDLQGLNGGVMIGHLTTEGLTPDGVPASQSPEAVARARQDLGPEEIFVSDDLRMGAIDALELGPGEAEAQAIIAGIDLALFVSEGPDALEDELDAATAAIRQALEDGDLSEAQLDASASRLFGAQGIDPCDIVSGEDVSVTVPPTTTTTTTAPAKSPPTTRIRP